MGAKQELEDLKKSVRRFLKEIRYVPIRPADCNQTLVYELESDLRRRCKRKPVVRY